jgi:hypothetical protein
MAMQELPKTFSTAEAKITHPITLVPYFFKYVGTNYGMFNDLGVYGVPRGVRERKRFDAVTAMRSLFHCLVVILLLLP